MDWLAILIVGGVVLGSGCVLLSTILRAVWARKERESLTSDDLRALEESVVLLIQDLEEQVDRGIKELSKRAEVLERMIEEADERIRALQEITHSTEVPRRVGSPHLTEKVLGHASAGLSPSEIARTVGASLAEVDLILRVAQARAGRG